MSYELRVTRRALRGLQGLPPDVRDRITKRMKALADDPRVHGTKQLQGTLRSVRRLRVGDYRIGYEVDDAAALVIIRAVGHRQHVYDELRRGL